MGDVRVLEWGFRFLHLGPELGSEMHQFGAHQECHCGALRRRRKLRVKSNREGNMGTKMMLADAKNQQTAQANVWSFSTAYFQCCAKIDCADQVFWKRAKGNESSGQGIQDMDFRLVSGLNQAGPKVLDFRTGTLQDVDPRVSNTVDGPQLLAYAAVTRNRISGTVHNGRLYKITSNTQLCWPLYQLHGVYKCSQGLRERYDGDIAYNG